MTLQFELVPRVQSIRHVGSMRFTLNITCFLPLKGNKSTTSKLGPIHNRCQKTGFMIPIHLKILSIIKTIFC